MAGDPVDVGPARQRGVLAALAADAGRPVPAETLIDRVWGAQVPQRVRHTLYVYIANLRKALPDAVVRRPGGYLLDVDPHAIARRSSCGAASHWPASPASGPSGRASRGGRSTSTP